MKNRNNLGRNPYKLWEILYVDSPHVIAKRVISFLLISQYRKILGRIILDEDDVFRYFMRVHRFLIRINVQPPNFAHPLISPTKLNWFLTACSSMNMIFLLRQVRLIVYLSFYGKKIHPWGLIEDLCGSLAKTESIWTFFSSKRGPQYTFFIRTHFIRTNRLKNAQNLITS